MPPELSVAIATSSIVSSGTLLPSGPVALLFYGDLAILAEPKGDKIIGFALRVPKGD